MTANSDKLRQLARAIDERSHAPAVPATPLPTPLPAFDMRTWAKLMWRRGKPKLQQQQEIAICTTVACIAGSAVALFAPEQYKEVVARIIHYINLTSYESNGMTHDVSYMARDLLGLTEDQTHCLFSPPDTERVRTVDAILMLDWLADNPDAVGYEIQDKWTALITTRERNRRATLKAAKAAAKAQPQETQA